VAGVSLEEQVGHYGLSFTRETWGANCKGQNGNFKDLEFYSELEEKTLQGFEHDYS
jgi:hypothetical protein